MTNVRELLSKSKYDQVGAILKTAGRIGDSSGMEVYAVGGLVRDLLMSKILNDIDIMTVGEGIPFAKQLAGKLGVKKIVPLKNLARRLFPINQYRSKWPVHAGKLMRGIPENLLRLIILT